jgi:hypothetical protein
MSRLGDLDHGQAGPDRAEGYGYAVDGMSEPGILRISGGQHQRLGDPDIHLRWDDFEAVELGVTAAAGGALIRRSMVLLVGVRLEVRS